MGKTIDKLAWLPVRNRAVLFARSRGQILFYCAGGKREKGETDEQALVREVREETGATLLSDTIRYIHTFMGPSHGAPEGTLLKMTCYEGEWEGDIVPSSEIEELAWFTTADMDRTTKMGHVILKWLSEQRLID